VIAKMMWPNDRVAWSNREYTRVSYAARDFLRHPGVHGLAVVPSSAVAALVLEVVSVGACVCECVTSAVARAATRWASRTRGSDETLPRPSTPPAHDE
jgi:hypothetical protein